MIGKKSLFSGIPLLLFAISAFGAPVSFETAQSVARHHLERTRGGKIKPAQKTQTKTLKRAAAAAATPYFVIEKENGGFIVVSADDIAVPVLGETDSGSFDKENMPPALLWLLETYEEQIEKAVKSGAAQDNETKRLWEQATQSSSAVAAASYPHKLLSTTWNQLEPYNLQCPLEETQRSLTGCVATAMAQIMKYWQHPAYGTGEKQAYSTYSGDNRIDVPSVNFNTSYDYASMLNNYTAKGGTAAERDAVSKLMFHCGASVSMQYSSAGSGAYSYRVRLAMVQNFGYDNSILYISDASGNSRNISASDWKDLIIGQIENNSPVFYAGGKDVTDREGHAFIIDGYNDNTDKFHLNWGWGGSYDGFFALTALNPGTYQFSEHNTMTINIMPDQGGNPPSQIKVTRFNVSTTQTAISADIRAKMNYGVDFSGKIGFAAMSGGAVGVVLDSADYSITNKSGPALGEYTVNYAEAQLGRQFGADMPSGDLTLQVVTKRGAGAWTPVGDTRLISPHSSSYTVVFDLNGGDGAAPAAITDVPSGGTLSEAQKPPSSGFTKQGLDSDGKWYIRTGTAKTAYVYTEFVFGAGGTPVTGNTALYLGWKQGPWDCGANGSNVTAALNNGTLTVSGTGAMANYSALADIPWYNIRNYITHVIIQDGVTSIGNRACAYSGLTSVAIPSSVASIGDNAFQGCADLTSVTIPNSVASIGNGAFSSCGGLTSITIGDNVASIGNNAFYSCAGLTSITIGDKVTSIGNNAFSSCTGLTSVTIPNSVKTIGANAFSNCRGLISVTIGNSVDSIGNYAFGVCTGLTSVTSLAAAPPKLGASSVEGPGLPGPILGKFSAKSNVFSGVDVASANLYVPAGSVGAYNNADVWKDFGSIHELQSASVAHSDRVTPAAKPSEEAVVIAPAVILGGEFTAGPNPVGRTSGGIAFFWQGRRVSGTLAVYDAAGNVIKKITINDNALNNPARRKVGAWDLTDKKGRPAPEGTYLVKGALKTSDRKNEKVSHIVSVR